MGALTLLFTGHGRLLTRLLMIRGFAHGFADPYASSIFEGVVEVGVEEFGGLGLHFEPEIVEIAEEPFGGVVEALSVTGVVFGAKPVAVEKLAAGFDVEALGDDGAGLSEPFGVQEDQGQDVGDVNDPSDHLLLEVFRPHVSVGAR